jgi:hypothetical protein
MPKVTFEIKKVTVISGVGSDKIVFHTTHPDPCFPFDPKSSTVEMQAAANQGAAYVLQHWPDLSTCMTVIQRG